MNFQIETAQEEHIPAIIKLMHEFAGYENLLEYLEITEEKLCDALFGENGFVECLIAVSDDEPFAYALYYLNFSSFRGQTGVYLEDIYIRKDFRKYGIGELMLKQIARAGKEIGRGADGFSGSRLEHSGNKLLQKTRRGNGRIRTSFQIYRRSV